MGVSDCNKYVNSPPKEIVINVPKVKEIPVVDKHIEWSVRPGQPTEVTAVPPCVPPKHRGWPKGKPRK